MTPRMGARRTSAWLAALALGFGLAGAGSARADDGVTLTRFKLPDASALERLDAQGADLAENRLPGPNGSVYADIVVTPQQKAQYEAEGYQAVVDLQDEATAERNQRDRNATIQAERNAYANLRAGTGRRSAAATDTVQAQRADYFENYAGRYISIEGWVSDNALACGTRGCTYSGPPLTASWLDAGGNTLGTGALQPFVDDNIYQYHTALFRVGALDDGGTMPATVKIASANGGVDTIKVRPWTSRGGTGQYPNGFQKDFITHYVDPQEAYQKIRDLAQTYPGIASIVQLPEKTPGYQRLSQAIVGTSTPYDPMMTSLTSAGSVAAADQPKAVVLTSKLMGQDGGNQQSITLVDPHAANSPLSVSVSGNDVTVSLGTDGTGALSSTAAQVVTAIDAMPAATALMTAALYRTNTGAGIAQPTAKTMLSDFLKAPASYPRGPQTQYMLRIGSHQDGSKTGVFIYCQEHAREWVTPLVCLETAQRLLANYGTDAETTKLIDNLDVFIVPVINADGAAYSMYDYNQQRKNMVDYCGQSLNDPTSRNGWGVDLNRNFSVGSIFDGFSGASPACNSATYSGPSELSEPETRNETWVQNRYTNIKFAMNIHSYGGYFMWPPGAYKTAGREPLPYPSYGTLQYFQQTADTVLDRIKTYRGTVVLPSQTGPVIDVLYSAAGNSADEAWYNHDIFGYDFEVGADRFATSDTCAQPGTQIAEPTCLTGVNFQPVYAPEGHDEAMEFANGNYALLESALAYENDTTPPKVTPVGPDVSPTPFDVTFDQDEAAEIHYTTDGSTPTMQSTLYGPPRPRALPTPIRIDGTTTLRWIATDIKGNTSTGSKTFYIGTQGTTGVGGTVPATLALALGGTPASFGAFTPGLGKDYLASTTATVTSTAGDAALIVQDTSPFFTNHLVNGSFALPQELQVRNNTGAFQTMPAGIRFWGGPTSNEVVPIDFKQSIGATDPLRTGSYSKTLTFTLSTTTP